MCCCHLYWPTLVLSSLTAYAEGHHPPYDVSEDGRRFMLVESLGEDTAQPLIRIVMNWFTEFADR